MTDLTPDAQGLFLSLRRPLSKLIDADLPPAADPFDAKAEVATLREALRSAIARIPVQHLDRFRQAALAASKAPRGKIYQRASKRQAAFLFEEMVRRGLKPAGPDRGPEELDIELLMIRFVIYSLLIVTADDDLIEANRTATLEHLAIAPDPEDAPDDNAVYWALRHESSLYMEVMDANGTTERFLARQSGRVN